MTILINPDQSRSVVIVTGAVVAVHNIANQLIRHTLETTMMASDSNRHLSAASALLELTCDAVSRLQPFWDSGKRWQFWTDARCFETGTRACIAA